MPNLTSREEPVLQALCELSKPNGEYCVPFSLIAERMRHKDVAEVRRIVRALKRKGWAEYYRGLFTIDGEICGSGHCISIAGLRLLGELDLKRAITGELLQNQEAS